MRCASAYAFGTSCGDGQLNISTPFDPCGPGMDDSFEPNDTCAEPVLITDGTYPGLFVSVNDDDYYLFLLCDGDTVQRVSKGSFGPGDFYSSPWHLFAELADGVNDWNPKYTYD